MVYPISANKLRSYQRCPYSYYLRYEKRVSSNEGFGSVVFGTALNQTLAKCHRDWHYHDAIPDRRWFHKCWDQFSDALTLQQVREGRAILDGYYDRFIANQTALRQPLGIDGKIQANLQVANLEFQIVGRYDRIDFLPEGLELIIYKSAKEAKPPEEDEIAMQMGLYSLALEQTYQQSLKYFSLLFLRTGEKVCYRLMQKHQQQVIQTISQLAKQLRQDQKWQPTPGNHCSQCSFSRYCEAANREPAKLPTTQPARSLQLAFSL